MESPKSRRLTVTLERVVAGGAHVTQVADAIVVTWRDIDSAISPILGQQGLAALYRRSLYLCRGTHPWLAANPEGGEARMDLTELKTVLTSQDSATAAAGGGAHLQALYELLGSLIGPSLTEQMLRSAWENSFGGPTAQDLST